MHHGYMHNKYMYHRYVQCTLCTIDSRHMHILSLISKSFMHHTSIPHRYTHQRYKNHKYVYYKYICHRYVHHNSIHVSRFMHHRFMHSRYIHSQTHICRCRGGKEVLVNFVWVTRPERPKGAKDEVKRPEGPPIRSRGLEGPLDF